MTPPTLAVILLRWLLPRRHTEPIIGDLEEDFAASHSRRRFWHLALRSIASCWVDHLRFAPRAQGFTVEGDRAMHSLMQDIRYGLRLMRRNPGFTAAAVITLALGIGANAAIFGVVNVLSLKPLSYHDPSRVAFVLGWDLEDHEMRFNLRHADFLDLRRGATTFAALGAYSYLSANLTGGDVPDRVQAYRVTPNMFELLGVAASRGQTFTNADRTDVAVISHALWQRRFGGDPAIVGRQIVVNGEPTEIIAVMPPRFEFPVFNFKGDLWLVWDLRDSERGQPDARGSLTVVGRLRDGVGYSESQAQLDVLMRGFAGRYPESNRGLGARVIEMGKLDDEQAGPAITIVLITVAMVLLLACANVANLLLARGAARQRELAVRAAIGASRLRIVRQLLIEGTLLAIGGGAVGVGIAVVTLDALRASLPDVLASTMPNIDELGVDVTTLGYTILLSLLTSAMFGVLPAWRATRGRFEESLKESAAAGGSRGARRLRSTLVVAEVALATILVIVAGLLSRSYASLNRISPGFESAGVMTMALTLPEYRYSDAAARLRFYDQVLERVDSLPGVEAAAFVNVLPFSTYDRGIRVTIDGAPPPEPGREPSVAYRISSARYHEAMQIPLIAGRYFERDDNAAAVPVAIVNDTFARRHFGERNGLGMRIRLGAADSPWRTIVGVVGDVHHSTLTTRPQPELYVPMTQADTATMMLAARTPARPEDMTAPIERAIRSIDASQPVYHVKTLDALVAESIGPQRMSAATVRLFGGLALVLATIGIYGVISYSVSLQTREFGVRIALGATPSALLAQVLRSGGRLVGLGVTIGVAVSLGAAVALRNLLVGISAIDPLTFAGATALLILTGFVASVIPARRAAATAPIHALRED